MIKLYICMFYKEDYPAVSVVRDGPPSFKTAWLFMDHILHLNL